MTNKLSKVSGPALIAIVVLLILVSAAVKLAPRLGVQIADIGSGSMSPTLKAGTMVITSRVDPTELKTGDIIVFKSPIMKNNNTCHRIAAVLNTTPVSFQTKGDNLAEPDNNAVQAADIVGRVDWHVGGIGYFVQFLKTSIGLLTCLIIPAVILIGMCLRSIWQELIKVMREKIGKEARQ